MARILLDLAIMEKFTRRKDCLMDDTLPPFLELVLKELGVLKPVDHSMPTIKREYKFRTPVLDAKGEPDF